MATAMVTAMGVAMGLCNRRFSRVGGLLMLMSSAVPAQVMTVLPRVSVSEIFTDNVRLTSTGKQAEQVTEISPGLTISSSAGRLQGYFDYSLIESGYAQNSSPRRTQHALTTFGTLEAVDNWAYLDFGGSISQQATSAFGTQSIGNTALNANKSEVSSYRLSPYLRGPLGNLANYEARYSQTLTQSASIADSRVTAAEALLRVSASTAFRQLGWSASVNQSRVDYSAGRTTDSDRLNLGLSYLLTPQLSVSVNGGREATNYTGFDTQSATTHGVAMNWSPSDTTRISASKDSRPFGDTHSVRLEHRTARTAWTFTDTRDVSSTPSQSGLTSIGPIYDILYSQFATVAPDPLARAQLVNAYMQANGIRPDQVVLSSFLTSAMAVQRRQDLVFAVLGVRDTITFIATRTDSHRLDTLSIAQDDLTSSSRVRQRGFTASYSHRLTPDYSLGIFASQQNTSDGTGLQDSKLRSVNVNLSGRVGQKSSVALGLRHTRFSSPLTPYDESAVTFNLNTQF